MSETNDNQNSQIRVGTDLARLRLSTGAKQSKIAEALKVDTSRISRICEVQVQTASKDTFALVVYPHSHEEVFRTVSDFCASLIDAYSGPTAEQEGRGVSEEVNKALRNMAGLARKLEKGPEGKPQRLDPAMELVRACHNSGAELTPEVRKQLLAEVTAEVLKRLKLEQRITTEFRFDEDSRVAGFRRLREPFANVNKGLCPDVSLPRRADLIVPMQLLGKRPYAIRIIDTKGVDDSAIRPDIRAFWLHWLTFATHRICWTTQSPASNRREVETQRKSLCVCTFASLRSMRSIAAKEIRVHRCLSVAEILVRNPAPPRSGGVNEQITTLLPDAEPTASGVPAPAAGVDYEWAVEQFYEALYKFAFGLAGSESDAADLTQDTYRVLLTKGDAIRDARKVKSWLFTTLYRQFLGRRRHATRFPETPIESAEWELPTISASHAQSLDASFVVAALQQLEEKYRAPLAMFSSQIVPIKRI